MEQKDNFEWPAISPAGPNTRPTQAGMEAAKAVAFLGTGIMGHWMVQHMFRGSRKTRISVWNATSKPSEEVKAECLAYDPSGEERLHIASSPAEAVKESDVVMCMIKDGELLNSCLFGGPESVIEGAKRGALVVVMSSIGPEEAKAHSRLFLEKELRFMDAMVSGGESAAREGRLAIMVGGGRSDFDAASPLFSCFGQPTRVGPVGAGSVAKMCDQLISSSALVAVGEALSLAKAAGADPRKVLNSLHGSLSDSPVLREFGDRMHNGRFLPGSPLRDLLKGIEHVRQVSRSLGLNLTLPDSVIPLFLDCEAAGEERLDASVLIHGIERKNKRTETPMSTTEYLTDDPAADGSNAE